MTNWLKKIKSLFAKRENALVHYNVFTDGSFLIAKKGSNEKRNFGGYCSLILSEFPGAIGRIVAGGIIDLDNTQDAEIIAVLKVLELFSERTSFTIFTDCMYIINFCDRLNNKEFNDAWMLNETVNYRTSMKHLEQLKKYNDLHVIDFMFVKSHMGSNFNQICDEVAKSMAYRTARTPDKVPYCDKEFSNAEK